MRVASLGVPVTPAEGAAVGAPEIVGCALPEVPDWLLPRHPKRSAAASNVKVIAESFIGLYLQKNVFAHISSSLFIQLMPTEVDALTEGCAVALGEGVAVGVTLATVGAIVAVAV